jgi:two-component system, OmpR family, phosphate regulon response regulator PhoB
MVSILIVEDEPDIREVIRFSLETAGFQTVEAGHAEEALQQLSRGPVDLVLLDWMLPGCSGLELARQLRRNGDTRGLPIILLTARTEESAVVDGLDVGADDYITKPFSPRELVARIHAVLRRTQPSAVAGQSSGGLHLDSVSHRVSVYGQFLNVTPTEFRLLQFFMTHRERVYSRARLLEQIWGAGSYVEERTVDVHIRRLRQLLEPTGHDRLIQTVRGAGYRFSNKP